jgi:hypothetical protein
LIRALVALTALMILPGCSRVAERADGPARKGATMSQGSSLTVVDNGAGSWTVRCERRIGDHTATGEARIQGESLDHVNPPHAVLAGARAWLVLGQRGIAAGHFTDAITATRGGLDELGNTYRAPGVKDDTGMKIDAADEQITEGHSDAGARVLLRVLEARIGLYIEAHPDVR